MSTTSTVVTAQESNARRWQGQRSDRGGRITSSRATWSTSLAISQRFAPRLLEHFERVRAHPKVRRYHAERGGA
jgi:hypothetical protein